LRVWWSGRTWKVVCFNAGGGLLCLGPQNAQPPPSPTTCSTHGWLPTAPPQPTKSAPPPAARRGARPAPPRPTNAPHRHEALKRLRFFDSGSNPHLQHAGVVDLVDAQRHGPRVGGGDGLRDLVAAGVTGRFIGGWMAVGGWVGCELVAGTNLGTWEETPSRGVRRPRAGERRGGAQAQGEAGPGPAGPGRVGRAWWRTRS
jgi:hypothetical protein